MQPETVQIENGHLSAHLVNTKNNVLFTLDLFLLKENRFRFRVNELNPLRKRYEVEGVVIDSLEQEKSWFLISYFTYTFEKEKVKPFL